MSDICAADVEPDGMVFDPGRFVGLLGKARVAMQIDVGFGDVVTPSAQHITYPALLDFPAPALAGYPRETPQDQESSSADRRDPCNHAFIRQRRRSAKPGAGSATGARVSPKRHCRAVFRGMGLREGYTLLRAAVDHHVHQYTLITMKVSAAQFKAKMGRYMKAVRAGGEVVITDRDEPVARLSPFRRERRAERTGSDAIPADPGAPPLGDVVVSGIRYKGPVTTNLLRADRDRR